MEKKTMTREAKIIFNKSGGTAKGNNPITNRVTIPSVWIKDMGLSADSRDVTLEYDDVSKCILVKKKQL